jgi:hypothetical protein
MKSKKKSYTIFVISIVILSSIFFFIPKIFSTKAGSKFILKKIEKKLDAKITVDFFNLNWLGPQTIKNLIYKDSNLDIKVDSIISKMNIFSFYKSFNTNKNFELKSTTNINDLNIHFHYPNLPEASIYNVFSSIQVDNGINSIKINGKTIEDNKTGNIQVNLEINKDKVNAKILGTNIPTIAIDHLIFFNNKKYQNMLVQLLGSVFNIEITSFLDNKVGPIDINFNSPYSAAKINLIYQKDKIALKQQASITFNFPGIKPTFIKNINYIKSIKPISVKISEKDFLLPISPFILEKLNLMNAEIDLNKMIISNTGIIKTLTTFAKLSSSEFVSIWFTNLNLQINNKTLFTDRVDFLINDELHLCSWGKIDLFDHNIRLNLGIPSDTLFSIFGIQNLPSDYVIKIPITGTLENPKFDAKSATAKILALSALQSKKGLGSLIGGVLSRIKQDEKIPPPKKPFPWEGKVIKKSPLKHPIDLDRLFK